MSLPSLIVICAGAVVGVVFAARTIEWGLRFLLSEGAGAQPVDKPAAAQSVLEDEPEDQVMRPAQAA